jgi:hypothetical protein
MIIVLHLLFTFFVFACEDINLYETHPRINLLPIQNQGAMNTCYAHSLATVYNMEQANQPEDMVDLHWIAFVHKQRYLHWQPRSMDFSLLSWAWSDLKKVGFCQPSYVQDAIKSIKQSAPYSDDQLFYLLSEYFKIKNDLTTSTQAGFELTMHKLLKLLPLSSGGLFEIPWDIKQISTVLLPLRTRTHKKSFFSWMSSDLFKPCLENTHLRPQGKLNSLARLNESNQTIALAIESLLAKNKPLAVGFCSNIFKNMSVNATVRPRILKAISSGCSAHYATVVGSRKKAQSCQYLIRNSSGSGFWPSAEYSCHCRDKKSGLERECYHSESTRPDLEVLGCWIDRDRLLHHTFDLSYFN